MILYTYDSQIMNTKTKMACFFGLLMVFSFCTTLRAKPRINYSEEDFRRDISKGRDLGKILQLIEESNEAEVSQNRDLWTWIHFIQEQPQGNLHDHAIKNE